MSEKSKETTANTPTTAVWKGADARSLARALRDSREPEALIKTLPTQSIYMAIQSMGLESAVEYLDILPTTVYRSLLDFELWSKDAFDEERFWHWLAVIDEEGELERLALFLRSIDINVLQLIIQRHVDIIIREDPEDQPPGPGYFTPDRGYSWLGLRIDDATRHRLLGRLLAYLFSSNQRLFYQLLAESGARTVTEIEEEAYQQKTKRLEDEGLPDWERCCEFNSPLDPKQVNLQTPAPRFEAKRAVVPVIYENFSLSPLQDVLASLAADPQERASAESSLTAVMNASLIFYGIAFHESEEVSRHLARVRGAINIGLQSIVETGELSPLKAYQTVGFEQLYKIGIYHLRELRRLLSRVPEENRAARAAEEPVFDALYSTLLQDFPMVPEFLNRAGELEVGPDETLSTKARPFELLEEVRALKDLIRRSLLQ